MSIPQFKHFPPLVFVLRSWYINCSNLIISRKPFLNVVDCHFIGKHCSISILQKQYAMSICSEKLFWVNIKLPQIRISTSFFTSNFVVMETKNEIRVIWGKVYLPQFCVRLISSSQSFSEKLIRKLFVSLQNCS